MHCWARGRGARIRFYADRQLALEQSQRGATRINRGAELQPALDREKRERWRTTRGLKLRATRSIEPLQKKIRVRRLVVGQPGELAAKGAPAGRPQRRGQTSRLRPDGGRPRPGLTSIGSRDVGFTASPPQTEQLPDDQERTLEHDQTDQQYFAAAGVGVRTRLPVAAVRFTREEGTIRLWLRAGVKEEVREFFIRP